MLNSGKKIIFLYLLVSCAALRVSAQKEANYLFRIYTQEEGLASGSLTGIAKGNIGFLWLFSENGLSRFDGHSFKVFIPDLNNPFSISSYNTQSLLVDGNGCVNFKSDNAICKYLPDSGLFKCLVRYYQYDEVLNYLPSDSGIWVIKRNRLLHVQTAIERTEEFPLPSGFSINRKDAVFGLNGKLWMTNDTTLFCFDPALRNFTAVGVESSGVRTRVLRSLPLVFFTGSGKETCYYSAEGLFRYDRARRLFSKYASSAVPAEWDNPARKCFLHKDYFIIIPLTHDTVYTVDIRDGATRAFALNPGSAGKVRINIFDVISSYDGSLWISTTNAGVYRINPFNNRRERIFHDTNNSSSLLSDHIEYLFEVGPVLFMTSPGIGLIKAEVYQPVFNKYQPSDINEKLPPELCNNITALAEEDQANILVGTLAGLFRFNKESKKISRVGLPADKLARLQSGRISAIVRDAGGNFWISCQESREIYKVNLKNNLFSAVVPDPEIPVYGSAGIRCLFIDSYENLWAGTDRNVIYRLPLRDLNPQHPANTVIEKIRGKVKPGDILIFNSVYTFYESPDKLLYIGSRNGFYVYDPGTRKFTRYTNTSPDELSISNENVHAILAGKSGQIWFGTAGGGLNLSSRALTRFKTYSTDRGKLSDNFIYSILGDMHGNLWMGTNRGICRFDPRKEYYRNFTVKDGIQGNEFNTNAAIRTSSGELIFGGINGFNMIYPDSAGLSTDTPAVVISDFRVNEKSYPNLHAIRLAYNENDIAFEFAGLSYYRTRENQYAYKMEGLQNGWVYLRSRRYVNFTNLPPGHYVFHVKGCNYNGVWNEKGLSMDLFIARPYWATWWFRSLVILLLAGIFYMLLRYYYRHKLKIEKIRNNIAKDLHDEIGSNLSGISLFSSVAKEKLAVEPTAIPMLLSKISEYTQASQDAINDIVWMINARNDTFERIAIRMRKQSGELFESRQVNLFFNFDENLLQSKTDIDIRKNLYLVFKEAVNNILKYACCKNVWIDLSKEGQLVRLKIRDDGKGFDMHNTPMGNGIDNMQKRAHAIGGRFKITSAQHQGTTVELEFSN